MSWEHVLYPVLETTLGQTKHIRRGFRKVGIDPWDEKAVKTDKLKPGEAYVPLKLQQQQQQLQPLQQRQQHQQHCHRRGTLQSRLCHCHLGCSHQSVPPNPALPLSPGLPSPSLDTDIVPVYATRSAPGSPPVFSKRSAPIPTRISPHQASQDIIDELTDNTDQMETLRTQSTEFEARFSCAAEERQGLLERFVGAKTETERTCNVTAEMTAPVNASRSAGLLSLESLSRMTSSWLLRKSVISSQ